MRVLVVNLLYSSNWRGRMVSHLNPDHELQNFTACGSDTTLAGGGLEGRGERRYCKEPRGGRRPGQSVRRRKGGASSEGSSVTSAA